MAYSTGWAADGSPPAALLELANAWSLERMTAINREILAGRSSPETLRLELDRNVLAHLPSPERLTEEQAKRLVVILGLAGASLGRHYQEAADVNRGAPEAAFAGLRVGAGGESFLQYFARLAEQTGSDHGPRDSYASLVRWNLPEVDVHWGGRRMALLPSAFDDDLVRSYTGVDDEFRFFGLLKASEAIELAVNQQLLPLSDGSVDLQDDEALLRIARAVHLLDALREMNSNFATVPSDQSLNVGYFLDVFRQFAIHWRPGDLPPSGAQDTEALARDLIVGIALPSYPDDLRRLFPSLLHDDRALLESLMHRPSLPEAALRLAGRAGQAGLDATGLKGCTVAEMCDLTGRYPVLAALYLLLNAHARVAGVHLMLSKRFLFRPQQIRDSEGKGDPGVVSNRTGTTGMDESRLEGLTRARHEHALAPLRNIPGRPLEAIARPDRIMAALPSASPVAIRFSGSVLAPVDLGLSALADARPVGWRARS